MKSLVPTLGSIKHFISHFCIFLEISYFCILCLINLFDKNFPYFSSIEFCINFAISRYFFFHFLHKLNFLSKKSKARKDELSQRPISAERPGVGGAARDLAVNTMVEGGLRVHEPRLRKGSQCGFF